MTEDSDVRPGSGPDDRRWSALEEEVLVSVVHEEGDLVEQVRVGVEALVVDDGERHLTRLLDPRTVPAERRELEVATALLALAHDRALPPQVEVDLGEGEPVVRLDQ